MGTAEAALLYLDFSMASIRFLHILNELVFSTVIIIMIRLTFKNWNTGSSVSSTRTSQFLLTTIVWLCIMRSRSFPQKAVHGIVRTGCWTTFQENLDFKKPETIASPLM